MKINNQDKLIKLLETEFPLTSQEPWDFGGFSFFATKEKDLKIIVTLDVDKKTILRAIRENVSLIISHHPFCFAPSKIEAIKLDPSKEELFNLVKENNIATYSLHTSFDSHTMGTDYYLLKKLDLLDKIIKRYKFNSIVEYSKSFSSLTELIKSNFNLEYVISNWSNSWESKVGKIYFAPGAGDVYEFIKHNAQDNCDLLITSDIKWNEKVVLQNLGINFIIVSHKVEEVFIEGINQFLKDKVSNDVEIILDYQDDFLKKY